MRLKIGRGRLPRGVAGLLLFTVSLMVACNETLIDPTGSSTTTVEGTTLTTPEGTAQGTTQPPKKKNLVTWLLALGPSAPAIPTEFAIYEKLESRQCDSISQDDLSGGWDNGTASAAARVYRGAASACRAAFHGQPNLWAAAEEALGQAGSQTSNLACIDLAVLDLLRQLVKLHRSNPEGEFEVGSPAGGGISGPCPTLSRLDPDRGPQGTEVKISGANLSRLEQVEVAYDSDWGSEFFYPGTDFPKSGDSIAITIPIVDDAPSACIILRTGPGNWDIAGKRFQFDLPAASPDSSAARFSCPPRP